MDKISVIVPCRNSESTLHRCLDSILNQTHKNIEVIVVDDGSTDGSRKILHQYTQKDERVLCVFRNKGSVGSARNAGLRIATGDYIQFVDSDDDVLPEMFEKLLRKLKFTRADVVTCRFNHDCFRPLLPAGTYYLNKRNDCLKFYSDFFTYNVPWNKLYKRSVITENFDETIRIFEDGLFALANFKNIKKVVVTEEKLYNYFNAGADNKASLVNNFLNNKFWETKEGYWFKFNALKPKFVSALRGLFADIEDFAHVRTFDMFFIELIKLIHERLPQDMCALEVQAIFNDPEFQKSTRYYDCDIRGITLNQINEFLRACYASYRYNPKAEYQREPHYVMVDLFKSFFKAKEEQESLLSYFAVIQEAS